MASQTYAKCFHGKKVGSPPRVILPSNRVSPHSTWFRVGVVWLVTLWLRSIFLLVSRWILNRNLAVVCIAAYRSQETHRKPDRAWLHGKRQGVPQSVPLCGVTLQPAFTFTALLNAPMFMSIRYGLMLILVIQQHSQFSVVRLAWKSVLSTAKQLPITLQSEIQRLSTCYFS